ncbi:RES domain-containing protein [Pararhizobium capsulatum DSM 1112]|uniref:RES domain-containing protein n=1 Tax=Pararhizobium capsulatum DSM 1112 TaxID=1121113 RepID=A0ABU0C0I3_9HYPH|nr:RES domain-containing protein [Pararhizobium capsulatum DSM 1112]
MYLSRAAQTALEEYRQGASITPPATLAAYTVALDPVVDLSEGFDPLIWDQRWAEWDCAWRKIARIDRKTPASWSLSDLAITAGYKGILFPSLRHAGGTNLVVFTNNLHDGDRVDVHDPDGRLPRDQSSWR